MRPFILRNLSALLLLALSQFSYSQYCIPTYTTGCTSGDDIDDFQMIGAGINHIGSGCSPAAYGDFTADALLTGNMSITETYNFSATHNFGSQYLRIYIDFNNNDSFEDPGELLFSSLGGSTNTIGSITIPVTATVTTTRMRVIGRWNALPTNSCTVGGGFGETHDYTVNILPPPTCPGPTLLATSNATSSTIDLNWINGGTETLWNIEYGPAGFTPGTGTTVVANANPFTVTGLNPATNYSFYIQADCGSGDVSSWSGPVSEFTSCVPFTATYTQDFNTTTTPNLPICWSSIVVSTATAAVVNTITTTTPNSLPNHVQMYNSATVGATTHMMLVSPQFTDLPSATTQIRFFAKRGASAENLIVGTMSDPTDPATFTPFTTITTLTNFYQEYTISFGTYVGTDQYIAFRHGNSAATRYIYIDDVVYEPLPSCPAPVGLTASNITTNSVDLNWINGDSETMWNIEYGPVGFTPGTGTVVAANTNPFTVTGLNPATDYTFYIQADCGGGNLSSSVWPISVTTACVPFTATYTQDFNTVTTPALPVCWSSIVVSTATAAVVNTITTTTPNSLPNHVQMYNSATAGATTHMMLVSPQFTDLPSATTQIRFFAKRGASAENLIVGTMSDPTDPATFTPFTTISTLTNTYQEFTVPFGSYVGTDQYIAFRHGNSAATRYIYIDDVVYEPLPSCPAPIGLTLSNPTSNSIDLNWTNGGSETLWNIEYGPFGFTPGTGTTVVAGTNPFTVSGLNPATNYSFYIQADCGSGDLSLWEGPVSIFTSCVPFTATYTQDFNTTTTPALPICWSSIVVSTATAAVVNTITTTTPNSLPNHVQMYNSATAGATTHMMLVSPQFTDLPSATTQIRFFAKRGASAENVIVGTMSDPTDPATFTPFTTISTLTNAYQEFTISFGSYVGTDQYIAFRHGNSAATRYIYIDDVVYEPIPSCPPISVLNASSPTSNSIDLNWTNGGTETSWNIEYGFFGFTPGTGTTVVAGTNPFTVSGLNPSTNYSFYVQADCGSGDLSSWVGPISMTTGCTPFTATYTQDFNSTATPALPTCWSSIVVSTSTFTAATTTTATTPNSLPNHVQMYNSATAGATTHLMMVSPQFTDLPSATTQIRFFAKRGASAEDLIVGTLSDPTDPATFTPFTTINTLTNTYQEYIVSFGSYVGTDQYIAFRHGNSAATRYIYIDDVVYEPIPSCPSPTFLTASNPSSSSVDLVWTNGGTEMLWNIEYGPVGFTPGTGTTVVANTNPFTVFGLNPATEYSFYIQADCGLGDVSTLNGPVSATTACLPFTAAFLESFSSGVIPICWTAFSGDGNTAANANWKFTGGGDYGALGNGGKPNGTFAWVDGSTPLSSQTILESPLIEITTLTNPTLSFELFSNNTNNPGDNMVFTVDISDGVTTTNVFTFAGDSSLWMKYQVDLSAYIGQTIKVIFTVDQTVPGTAFYNDILLDEVAICDLEDASFSYPTQLCAFDVSAAPTITGLTGGTFAANNGLIVDAATGIFDPSSVGAGFYEITYTSSTNPCSNSETFMVEIITSEDASFAYTINEACANGSGETPVVTGLSGGTFTSSPAGLSINASTGEIDPTASTPGNYTVQYTSSTSGCSSTSAVSFEIIDLDDASFNFSSSLYCLNHGQSTPTITGDLGGTFSAGAGLTINPTTGVIDPSTSTPGIYTVFYTTSGIDCPNSSSVQITIDDCLGISSNELSQIIIFPNPANYTLNLTLPEFEDELYMTMMDASGKTVFSKTISANVTSEEIDITNFDSGIYLITFTQNEMTTVKQFIISR